jgi:hypothetical protein
LNAPLVIGAGKPKCSCGEQKYLGIGTGGQPMKKQIEEIAKIMCHGCSHKCDDTSGCIVEDFAEDIYNAGYRSRAEGEWIKYPHNSGIYCSLCKHKRRYRDIHDAYCPNCGAKMKGE